MRPPGGASLVGRPTLLRRGFLFALSTSSTASSTRLSSRKCRNQWREEQNRCQREIEQHQTADQSYLEEGVRILELARNAQRIFEKQEPREKRRLLSFLVSNCSWKGGELTTVLRQPFDLLAKIATITNQETRGGRRDLTKRPTGYYSNCPKRYSGREIYKKCFAGVHWRLPDNKRTTNLPTCGEG